MELQSVIQDLGVKIANLEIQNSMLKAELSKAQQELELSVQNNIEEEVDNGNEQ